MPQFGIPTTFSRKLPSYLTQEGEWESTDGTLYKTPLGEFGADIGEDAFSSARELGKQIQEVSRPIAEKAISATKRVGEIAYSPGSTVVEPTLKKFGVPGGAAFAVGLGADILAPGVGGEASFVKKAFGRPDTAKVIRGFVESVKDVFPKMKVAGQYIPRSTDRLAMKARNFVLENIEAAEQMARTRTDDAGVAVGSELIKHYGDQAANIADEATKTALYDRGAQIANVMARKLTEMGRSVQAAAILGRLTPEGQVRFAAREIQRYNEAIEGGKGGIFGLRKRIPELSGEQADYILTEMKAIEGMGDTIEKAQRFARLQEDISSWVPSSLYDKVVAVWKAGLLTGVKTSGLNIFSNISHGVLETAKDIPAVAVDKVSSLFTKQRTLTLTGKGTLGGLREGFEKGWRYFRTGFEERDIGKKLDYRKVNFGEGRVAKALRKYEETVFRAIGSEDQPFYYGAKARSLYSQAIAKGKTQGLKGESLKSFADDFVNNPPDEAVRYAVLDAETSVFQQLTALGKAAGKLQEIPGGQFVVPFGRTPSAVATQILNYTPVGLANTIIQNISLSKQYSRFDQRLFSQGIGRGLTGTGILAIGFELAKKGFIALDRPKNEREQELWTLEGRQPNSVKIGNTWRTVQSFGPAGNLLLIGAHFQNQFKESGSPTEAIFNAIAGSAKSFSEQTFVRGVNQFLEAITDPARSASGFFGSLVASGVPTIVSDVARSTDPFERRTENIGERVVARIPGARRTLEPRITALGERQERAGNFFETMADPTRPSPIRNTPVVKELRRLTDAGYDVSPTKLGDKKGFPALTQKQNTELWMRAGGIARKKMENMLIDSRYNPMDDNDKAKLINEIVGYSKLVARVEKVIQLTEGLRNQELLSKLSELKRGKLLNEETYNAFLELR